MGLHGFLFLDIIDESGLTFIFCVVLLFGFWLYVFFGGLWKEKEYKKKKRKRKRKRKKEKEKKKERKEKKRRDIAPGCFYC